MDGCFFKLSFSAVELLLYSPERPDVEFSQFILWFTSVSVVILASIWEVITAPRQNDDHYGDVN